MLHAARNGCSRTIVRGNDICIILLAYLPTLLQCNSSYKLLFDCGTGASRFMFNINHIGDCIGLERCRGLLFVYSLSGCDLTPSFFGVGIKLKIFDLYISNTLTEEDLKVFKDLSSGPTTMTDEQFNRVVKFTLAAYRTKGAATCDLETARMRGILSPLVDSLRGCPHYASRRRASRRGPSGVVCLDTWAMRRDYSRLQA